MEKAVIDRIVDGETAVILVGEDEREYRYPAEQLPEGAREGCWLRVQIDGGEIAALELDQDETDVTRRRVQDKMDRLRARGRRAS